MDQSLHDSVGYEQHDILHFGVQMIRVWKNSFDPWPTGFGLWSSSEKDED